MIINPHRPVITTSYDSENRPIRRNASASVNAAVVRCVLHMQYGHYPAAFSAEVYDQTDGRLYCACSRTVKELRITYQRKRT